MKLSIILTLAILAIGALVTLQSHSQLEQLKREVAQLKSEPTTAPAGEPLAAKRPAVPDVALEELRAYWTDFEASKTSGSSSDPAELEKRLSSLCERIFKLSTAQLDELIAQVTADADLPKEAKGRFLETAIAAYGKHDAEAALQLLVKSAPILGVSNSVSLLSQYLLRLRAEKDPAAAFAWLDVLVSEHPKLHAEAGLANMLQISSSHGYPLTFRMLKKWVEPGGPDAVSVMLLNVALCAKSEEDQLSLLSETRTFLSTVSDTPNQERYCNDVLRKLADQVAPTGYDASMAWMDRAKLQDQEVAAFARGLSFLQTKADTGLWLEWIAKIAPGPYGGNTFYEWQRHAQGIMTQWVAADASAAGTWLEAQPPGVLRGWCLAGMAMTLAERNPETAAQWVLSLAADEDRQPMLRMVMKRANFKDRAASEAFAKQFGVK